MIVAYQINRGARFRLIAIGRQEDEKIHLPYFEFQREAIRRTANDWPKLVRILDYVVDAGPPKDSEKSKQLREGIFEFRTKGGLRLLWFYDEEIDEAIQWKNRYFEAKQTGKLKDITPK
jgi:hypothetical protein